MSIHPLSYKAHHLNIVKHLQMSTYDMNSGKRFQTLKHIFFQKEASHAVECACLWAVCFCFLKVNNGEHSIPVAC